MTPIFNHELLSPIKSNWLFLNSRCMIMVYMVFIPKSSDSKILHCSLMTGAAGRGVGHIPAGFIIWIIVNKYVALFTYLSQEQILMPFMWRQHKKITPFCVKKNTQILGLCKVLRLFHFWQLKPKLHNLELPKVKKYNYFSGAGSQIDWFVLFVS